MEVLRKSVVDHLNKIGIQDVKEIIYNPSYDELYEEELNPLLVGYEKAYKTELGALNVMTGKFTGRSPKDKFIVKDDATRDTLWWTSDKAPNDNKPTTPEVWRELKELVLEEIVRGVPIREEL